MIEFTEEFSKFGDLAPFMIFKHPFELEKLFNGFVNDMWEVERVLTQECYHLYLVWMVTLSSDLVSSYLTSRPFIINSWKLKLS